MVTVLGASSVRRLVGVELTVTSANLVGLELLSGLSITFLGEGLIGVCLVCLVIVCSALWASGAILHAMVTANTTCFFYHRYPSM